MFRHPQIHCFETYCSKSNPTTDSPSRWSTAMVPIIDLYGVQAIPGYGNIDVLSVGLTPWHPLPKLLQKVTFLPPGLRVMGRHQQAASLPFCCRGPGAQPDLLPGFRLLCRNSSFSLWRAVLQQGSTTYYTLQAFLLVPVINFSIAVTIKNGITETVGGNQKQFSM